MSTVATAKAEISDKPSAMAINAPTDVATQRAEVDRKLRFYGVIRAFMDGRFPDNKQIDEVLTYIQSTTPFDVTQLSVEGQELVEDARDVIESARIIVQRKNEGNLIQNFLYKGKKADVSAVTNIDSGAVPISKDKVLADKDKAAEHLRVLATLLATNSEARKLLSDIGVVAQDLFARGASKLASEAAPNQERLKDVDSAGPDAQWKSKDGQTVGTDATPHLELNLPGGNTIQADPHADPKNPNAFTVNGQAGGQALNDAANKAQSGLNQATEAKDSAAAEARQHAEDVQRRVDAETDPERKKEIAKEAGNEKVNMLKGKAADLKNKIPEEHRQRATDLKNRGTDKLKEEFPEERREQWIYRLKKVLVECQKHRDYQASMEWLIDTVATYAKAAKHTTKNVQGNVEDAASDPHANSAASDVRTILERFANNQSSQPISDALDNIATDVREDAQLRTYVDKVDDFVRRTLLEPGFIIQDSSTQEAKDLSEEGRVYFDPTEGKYAGHKDALFDSVSTFFKAMGDDPLNQKLGDDLTRLNTKLFFNTKGDLTFKRHLWTDIRQVIAPAVLSQIGLVPIPRIEYTDNMVDVVIENLVLQGQNLLPNIIEINANNHFKLSPFKTIGDEQSHKIHISLRQMQADMRDVGFAITKKSGFPRFRDHGLSDVFLGGDGLSCEIVVDIDTKDKRNVFKVVHAKAKIDTLKWAIRDSRHNTLYKLMRPLVTGVIKKGIEKAISEAIESALEKVNDNLVEVRDSLDRASNNDELSRTDALKQMLQRKKVEAQQTKAEAQEIKDKRNARFSIVTDPRESLIPNVNPPSAMLKRAGELNDKAVTGREWHSPAFSILDTNNTTTTGRVGQ